MKTKELSIVFYFALNTFLTYISEHKLDYKSFFALYIVSKYSMAFN